MEQSTTDGQLVDAALLAAVEKVLSVKITAMLRLTEPDRRSAVYRCTDEAGGSYIVKESPGYLAEHLANWESAPWAVKGFFNDWIGAEFLTALQLEERVTPRFYGGDAQVGFFVLEDLGEHHGLHELFLGSEPAAAEDALMRFGASLGRMHAITAGRVAEFEALFKARLPGAQPYANELDKLDQNIAEVRTMLVELGAPVTEALDAELRECTQAVRHPGPFLTYIHADPCPDNQFNLGDRYMLIDFEMGHFGHALIDATYPRMLWRTCWCTNRLPPDLVKRFEALYRAELAKSVPAAKDDQAWEDNLIWMSAFTMLMTFDWHYARAHNEDSTWGISTLRQRILARLEAFISTADEFKRLPALRGAASKALEVLKVRWAETPELPIYPAFQK